MKAGHNRSKNKSLSKSGSKGRVEFNLLKDLHRTKEHLCRPGKPKNKTKSSSKCKSNHRYSKESLKDLHDSRPRPLDRALPKHNLYIHNRKRDAVSSDMPEKRLDKKERFVRRK
jgi:hypothetical protein